MKRVPALLLAALVASSFSAVAASAGNVTVGRYAMDTEHKDEVLAFYLNTLLTGITMTNERARPPLFCMDNRPDAEPAFSLLDKRIGRLMKEGKISAETPIDGVILDMMMEEFPCR